MDCLNIANIHIRSYVFCAYIRFYRNLCSPETFFNFKVNLFMTLVCAINKSKFRWYDMNRLDDTISTRCQTLRSVKFEARYATISIGAYA